VGVGFGMANNPSDIPLDARQAPSVPIASSGRQVSVRSRALRRRQGEQQLHAICSARSARSGPRCDAMFRGVALTKLVAAPMGVVRPQPALRYVHLRGRA
jgi:hypothetical protein